MGKCLSHGVSRIFVVEGRTSFVWLVFYSPIVSLSSLSFYVAIMPVPSKQTEDAIAIGKNRDPAFGLKDW